MKQNGLIATADSFLGLLAPLSSQICKRGDDDYWTQDGEGWKNKYRHYTEQGEDWKRQGEDAAFFLGLGCSVCAADHF